MSNTAITAYEEERNANFQKIAALVVEARAKLAYLEQEMIDAFNGTAAHRIEEAQKELFRFYWNDEV